MSLHDNYLGFVKSRSGQRVVRIGHLAGHLSQTMNFPPLTSDSMRSDEEIRSRYLQISILAQSDSQLRTNESLKCYCHACSLLVAVSHL